LSNILSLPFWIIINANLSSNSIQMHNDLARVRFTSRHSNSKKYVATVQFTDNDDDEQIKGWFGTFSSEARVFGCCAHITALIWHLGVSRSEINSSDHQLYANNFLHNADDCI
jgi:hypothetical protein